MPIYEYRCKNCGAAFEFFCGFGHDENIVCRNCGSFDMEKIMSTASLIHAADGRTPGHTCCGREERCEAPPCSSGRSCSRR